jgi:hypothetical protein
LGHLLVNPALIDTYLGDMPKKRLFTLTTSIENIIFLRKSTGLSGVTGALSRQSLGKYPDRESGYFPPGVQGITPAPTLFEKKRLLGYSLLSKQMEVQSPNGLLILSR